MDKHFTLRDLLLPYQKRFVDSPERKKLWLSSRQIGKSFACSFLAVRSALTKPNSLSLCVSTSQRSAAELVKKCETMAAAAKVLAPDISYSASAGAVQFFNGSRIISLPSGNPASLRGWNANGIVVLDEAAFLERPGDIWQALTPTLTRCKDAGLVVCSTPAGTSGLFYDLYQKALGDSSWHIQTTTIDDAARDGLDVDVEELRQMVGDPDVFATEYLCQFASEFGVLVDTELLEFCQPFDGSQPQAFCGMDVAGSGSDSTAIADVLRFADGRMFVRDIIMVRKQTYTDQLKILKELHAAKRWHAGYIDSVGLGGPVAEFAKKQISARFDGFVWNESNKSSSYEHLRSLIFDKKLFFAEHLRDLVVEDFRNVKRIVTESGKVKFQAGHNAQGHSDAASALVLALQAAKAHPASIQTPIAYSRPSSFGSWSRVF